MCGSFRKHFANLMAARCQRFSTQCNVHSRSCWSILKAEGRAEADSDHQIRINLYYYPSKSSHAAQVFSALKFQISNFQFFQQFCPLSSSLHPRLSLSEHNCRKRINPKTQHDRSGNAVHHRHPTGIHPRPKQSHSTAQQQPPKRRTDKHARNQRCRAEIVRRRSKSESSKHCDERKDRHRIRDGQKKRGEISRQQSAATNFSGFFGWLRYKSSNAEIAKK